MPAGRRSGHCRHSAFSGVTGLQTNTSIGFIGLALVAVFTLTAQEASIGTTQLQGRTAMYRVIDGQAVVEGDISVGSPAAALRATDGRYRPDAMVVQGNQFLWPSGIIPYVIDSSLPDHSRVTDAMQQWNDQTPVRFVPRNGQPDYVLITRDANYGYCVSNVGRMGGQQRVTLSDQCATGNVLHELGHVIGLFHEQSRPDRDDYVRIDMDNIDKLQLLQFASALPYGNAFQIGNGVGTYDYGSIMHYGPLGFSRNGLATTVTNPPGITIGQTNGLSASDVAAVRRLYGAAPTGVVVTSNPPGLTVTVDGTAITTPQWFDWAIGSSHSVSADTQGNDSARYVFGRWNSSFDPAQDITVTPDLSVLTAHFVRQYKVSIAGAGPNGSVTIDPPSPDGFYPVGTTITLQAVPNDRQAFQFWSGRNYFPAHGMSANPAVFTLYDEGISYAANFSTAGLTSFVSDYPGTQAVIDGVTRTLPFAAQWDPGSSHTFSVVNPVQYIGSGAIRRKFIGWSTGDAATQTITVDGSSTTVNARFQQQFFVGAGTNLTGAGVVQVSPASADGYYDDGTQLRVSVSENPGYQFVNWSGDLNSGSKVESITVSDELVLFANLRHK